MNSKCKFLIVLSLIFIIATIQVRGEKTKGPIMKSEPKGEASCVPPSKDIELSLNLVRAYLKTNGTTWFKGDKAHYEVPKGSGKTSMFSSALWIGGRDAAGQLYVAAMRFAQVGNDYWTGPLTMQKASIDQPTCSKFDKFYRISRLEVEKHIRGFEENDAKYKSSIPKSILEWPATAKATQTEGVSHFLAPFKTLPGNDEMSYNPQLGDYPYYDLPNDLCPWTPPNVKKARECPWLDDYGKECDPLGKKPNPKGLPLPPERVWTRQHESYGWDNKMIYADHVLKGDETIFWFLNDRGGTHSESKCPRSIGLEIRVQAFAFATNDELNKMTFFSYEIINRGSTTLFETYFSQWVDPDVGNGWDDYVGCDVNRGLGYCYNGNELDTGEPFAYGTNPPAVGVDFFQGPYIDPDGSDNPRFCKDSADIISNNLVQQDYCKRFVHHLIKKWGPNGPSDLSETLEHVFEKDTFILRWNNQFAINGVNFGDSIIDNERFGMRRFVFHENKGGNTGDPEGFVDYYNLLRGIWKNGIKMTYGGNGYDESDNAVPCDFMFPKGTDYCNWGTQGVEPDAKKYLRGGRKGTWSEENPKGIGSAPNTPYDRRFMQSAGPFTLKQGACNYITVGIPWARATQGGKMASVALLMVADDKCQALFENCFKLLDGPDAPNLTIREYDQKLILLLSNSPRGNNANEDYQELDNTIPEYRTVQVSRDTTVITNTGDTITFPIISSKTVPNDMYYRFEGYQLFQVIGPEVGATDLDNPSLARPVEQFDIVNFDKDGNPIGRLINWEFDDVLQTSVPVEKVNGKNSGIIHSLEVTKDLFATGNQQLVNYKTYYFIAIAYAYNEFHPFNLENQEGLGGQKLPYLRGRKTAEGTAVTPIAAVPHPPSGHGGVLTLKSDYGSIPNITRVDGQGNGGIALELTKKTIDKIVRGGDKGDYRVRELDYEKNGGPLNIKIVDPLRVRPFNYTIVIKDPYMDSIDHYQKLWETEKKEELKEKYKDTVVMYQKKLEKADVSDRAYWVLTIDNDEVATDDALKEIGLTSTGAADGIPIREFKAQTTIDKFNEQIIFPLGISIGITNKDFTNKQKEVLTNWKRILARCYTPYKAKLLYCQPEKIDVTNDIVFANNGSEWITGLADVNVINIPTNWIRAGTNNLGVWNDSNGATHSVCKFYEEWRLEDAFFPSGEIVEEGSSLINDRAYKDYTGGFGTLCRGTWAPYVLTSPYDNCPQAKYIQPEPQPGITQPTSQFYMFQSLQDTRSQPGYNQTMTNLYSVDVVLTNDKSLWTRCIVLESCPDPTKSEGRALKNEPRKAKSVGKDGKPDGSTDGFGENGDEGMGWFPGYAINLETGERLNIMFSENSDSTLNMYPGLVNGNDMIFNPTSTYAVATKEVAFGLAVFPAGSPISQQMYDPLYFGYDKGTDFLKNTLGIERVWGGMHYVYVCGSSGNTSPIYYLNQGMATQYLRNAKRNFNLKDTVFTMSGQYGPYGGFIDKEKEYPTFECGSYDESKWLVQKFNQYFSIPNTGNSKFVRQNTKMQLFNNVMYTHIPLQPTDVKLQKEWLSCDVTYKIRVTRPYMRYVSRWYESVKDRNEGYSKAVPAEFDYGGFPVYKISTKEQAPIFNDTRVYQSILDNINIVPNPYYGGSYYESNALETMVKIINLPSGLKNNAPVTINIFTVSGILVRTLTKGDNETSYVNWDLKNYKNIPIAGGVYIIHVNCPGIGERTLKFFCTMRPTDLNSF